MEHIKVTTSKALAHHNFTMYRSSVIVAVLLFTAVYAEETWIEEINDDIYEADQPGNIPLFDVLLVQTKIKCA